MKLCSLKWVGMDQHINKYANRKQEKYMNRNIGVLKLAVQQYGVKR